MKLDDVVLRVTDLMITSATRKFACPAVSLMQGSFRFRIACNGQPHQSPESAVVDGNEIRYQFDGLTAAVGYSVDPQGLYIDETITLNFHTTPCTVNDINTGMLFDASSLEGFTATPIPFKVGLDGVSNQIDLSKCGICSHFAEGWVIDNGETGMLVMRVPTGDAMTCFVPLQIRDDGGQKLMQVGSIGPDGDSHFSRNPFLDTEFNEEVLRLPQTRFVFFKGNWKTGYEIFRQMVELTLSRCREPRRTPCPITYNTFHDFGPAYNRERLCEIMPQLSSMGIGMLHLDPGWETVWGSNKWNDKMMGTPEDFVREAASYGLKVGCWTSVHTTDPDIHNDHYIHDSNGEKYLAEDFTRFNPASVRLWGVCPASGWADEALEDLSRLGRAGLRFLNSDFHDWPWSGEGCRSNLHQHNKPLTRTQWALALNDFYTALHRQCPDIVIEMHDHIESGAYQTPVWYLYDRPDSYDEKWAYEFMWTTYQDLMDRKLFALYYLRLTEPVPLYLHINSSTDNENALAFWYVASCVTHIGVGALLRLSEEQRNAYRRAFAEYNARSEAFTLGRFYGIDELTHIHIYPDHRRAVILAFNLEDHPVQREVRLTLEDWGMVCGEIRAAGPGTVTDDGSLITGIGPRSVALLDLWAE